MSSTMVDYTDYVKAMEKAAREAGKLIRKAYCSKRNHYDHKSLFDYVTETDKQSEAIVARVLKNFYHDDPVVGEETFLGKRLPSDPCWIVDPLDGTTNFIHRFPYIAVTIARWDGYQVVAGCIYDPLRNEMFTVSKGRGVYVNGFSLELPPINDVAHSLVATGFPFRLKELTRAYLAAFDEIFLNVSDIRRAGAAALDLAYVAVGRVDGFWELGLKPWDVATGILMIEEVGGVVTDFWKKSNGVHNGNIVAARTPELHTMIFNAIQSHIIVEMEKLHDLEATRCTEVSAYARTRSSGLKI